MGGGGGGAGFCSQGKTQVGCYLTIKISPFALVACLLLHTELDPGSG